MKLTSFDHKLRETKSSVFCIIYFILNISSQSILNIAVLNSKDYNIWGLIAFGTLMLFTVALVVISGFERRGNKKSLALFLSFIPNSLLILIISILGKMQIISTYDKMWPLGTPGAVFFPKPDDIYIPIALMLIIWSQQEFSFKISLKNLLVPQMALWTFCSTWVFTDLMRFGPLVYGMHSDGNWTISIILSLLTICSFGGMLVSKQKENGIFWAIALTTLADNTYSLIYMNL